MSKKSVRRRLVDDRFFYHSFPRKKIEESGKAQRTRAVQILAFMKEVGLVLAPEVVTWDISSISLPTEPSFELLQQRACFTEIATSELAAHSLQFGPINLEIEISSLRHAGAVPVIYVPQGDKRHNVSFLAAFAIRGSFYSRMMFEKFNHLQDVSSPEYVGNATGLPVDQAYELNLQNIDPRGTYVNIHAVKAKDVAAIMQHLVYNDIPFEHSSEALNVLESMFYPTDNEHAGDILGYYRQREWRFVGNRVAFNGQSLCRALSCDEKNRLITIDESFWSKKISCRGVEQTRADAAVLYTPYSGWDFLDTVKRVLVPESIFEEVQNLIGAKAVVAEKSLLRK